MKKKLENIGNKSLPIVFIIVLLCLAQIILVRLHVPKYIIPTPKDVYETLKQDIVILMQHTIITLFEAIIGLIISIILAIIVGGILTWNMTLKRIIYPIILMSQMIPLIAIAPVILIWFGFGVIPKIIIVILVCVFPCLVAFLDQLEKIDESYIHLMKTMKANSWQIFFMLKLPACLQGLFSGLKIAATYSIMGAVIGEWLGAKNGLGIYMTRAMSSFKTEKVFAVIFIVILLSLSVYYIIEKLTNHFMPWRNK